MKLPERLQFNQANLQDFTDCRRRFLLKYVLDVSWPAFNAEPAKDIEQHMIFGAEFHRMVHKFVVGVSASEIEAQNLDPILIKWWRNFIQEFDGIDPDQSKVFSEFVMSVPMGSIRLVAKYDLIVASPDGHIKIVDWKTTSKKPRRDRLKERLQTRVYPFLLVASGFNPGFSQSVLPSQIEMIYWFSEFPKQSEKFCYSEDEFRADRTYLDNLIRDIQSLEEDQFPKTSDEKKCLYCAYRSLCERGIKAGQISDGVDLDEYVPSIDIEIDFDQLSEVEF